MSLETSRKILKVFGVLGIIGAILMLILGILAMAGGSLLAVSAEEEAETGALAVGAGIVLIITSIISLLEGIFSVRASKDITKIGPAWIFALLGVISAVIGFGSSMAQGGSIASSIGTLLINAIVFIAANTIKGINKNGGVPAENPTDTEGTV